MKLLIQLAVAVGLVGLAVGAGVRLSTDSVLNLVTLGLVLGTGVLAVTIQMRHGAWGLAALVVIAVLFPLQLGRGNINASFTLVAFLCGTWLIGVMLERRHAVLDGSRVVVAILAFMAIAVVAFVVGQYPWFPTAHAPMHAQVGGLALFLFSGALFLLVGHQIQSVRQLERLTWLFVLCGGLAVVTAVVPASDLTLGPVAITDSDSIGSMFWTWVVAIGLSQALCNRTASPLARMTALAVAGAALVRSFVFAFSWTSGWLPALVAAGVILLIRYPKSTIAAGLLVVTPALLFGGTALDAWRASESYSSTTRVEALRIMWQILQRNPWLGFGPANYYHYTVLFPILGWWVRFNSHNNYVDLIAQTGVVGLALFVWFCAEVLRLAVKQLRRAAGGFPRAYLVGVVGGLAGSLVAGLLADWIVPFAYNIGIPGFRSSLLFWLFLGGALALKRLAPAAQAVEAAAERGPNVRAPAAEWPFAPDMLDHVFREV